MFEEAQYRLLRRMWPTRPDYGPVNFYEGKSKLKILMGEDFFSKLADKRVVDFGCGNGEDSVEMAQNGIKQVIGIDIREEVLEVARRNAEAAGVQDACCFVTSTSERADAIVSVDAFEHFGDPGKILEIMNGLLADKGEVYVSFGPTWYHPLGGHMFSVFPWSHLIMSERAFIR